MKAAGWDAGKSFNKQQDDVKNQTENHTMYLAQPSLRDLREVVVLVVIAHIVGQLVQRPVVRVSLLPLKTSISDSVRNRAVAFSTCALL